MKRKLWFAILVVCLLTLTVSLWQSAKIIVEKDQNERLLYQSASIEQNLRDIFYKEIAHILDVRSFIGILSLDPLAPESSKAVENYLLSSRTAKQSVASRFVGLAQIAKSGGRANSLEILRIWKTHNAPNDFSINSKLLDSFTQGSGIIDLHKTHPQFLFQNSPQRKANIALVILPLLLPNLDREVVLFSLIDIEETIKASFLEEPALTHSVDYRLSWVAPDGQYFPIIQQSFNTNVSAPTLRRQLRINDLNLSLQLKPNKNFYSATDVILPTLVGAICLVAVIIVFYFLRATDKYMRSQQRSRQELEKAYMEISEKSENLLRLVKMMGGSVGKLEMGPTLERFIKLAKEIGSFDRHFLYLNLDMTEDKILLVNRSGRSEDKINFPKVAQRSQLEFHFKRRHYLSSEDKTSKSFEEQFLGNGFSKEWVALRLNSRSGENIGVLFLIRDNSSGLKFKEVESLQTLSAQASLMIESAWLFEKAKEASRLKSEFMANMSHEIRTPLNAIIGFSDILISPHSSAEHRHSAVLNIKKNGQQLIRIIDDILDLSNIESGKLPIFLKEIHFPDLIAEIIAVITARAQDKGIKFFANFEGQIPSKISGDEIRIKQVLLNILGNALKFTDRGVIEMIVSAKMEENLGKLQFTIVDTGIGIKPEIRKRIFQSFTQGDSSHSRRYGGTGLGLALAKKLAQGMEGDVELVDSRPQLGSCFRVILRCPILEAPWLDFYGYNGPTNRTESQSLEGKHGKILLVEDSEDNRDIFEYFLKLAGHQVHTVDNGSDAVEKVRQNLFDLILMDIQLPGINGKEAAFKIREEGFRNPIIALTAHAQPEEISSCLKAGCNGQISKPVSGEELVKAVDFYLQ